MQWLFTSGSCHSRNVLNMRLFKAGQLKDVLCEACTCEVVLKSVSCGTLCTNSCWLVFCVSVSLNCIECRAAHGSPTHTHTRTHTHTHTQRLRACCHSNHSTDIPGPELWWVEHPRSAAIGRPAAVLWLWLVTCSLSAILLSSSRLMSSSLRWGALSCCCRTSSLSFLCCCACVWERERESVSQ